MRTWAIAAVMAGLACSGGALADSWDYNGTPVSYTRAGAGLPVVQVHGIGAGASSEQTQYQVQTLVDAGYEVYSIDLPGWGESIGPAQLFTGPYYAEVVTAFLREVVPAPAVLVGHSLGASYAIGAAAAAPDRVTALVLNAPAGIDSFTEESNPRTARAWKKLTESAAGQSFYAALGSWTSIKGFCVATLYVDASFCDAETVYDYWQYTQIPESIYGAGAFLSGNLGLNLLDEVPQISAPALLIWGDANPFTEVSEGENFVALNPGWSLSVIAGGGAMVNDEKQAEFDTLMLEFLRSL